MKNSRIINEDRAIYNPNDPGELLDWMGYSIAEDNPLYTSFIDFDRSASKIETLLTRRAYQALKLTMNSADNLYESWLSTFSIIDRNLADSFPDEDLWQMIEDLHEKTEALIDTEETHIRMQEEKKKRM